LLFCARAAIAHIRVSESATHRSLFIIISLA
jgi:hypothetical protein